MEDRDEVLRQARYESYLMDLRSDDKHKYREAMEEAAAVAGSKEIKSYKNALLETVLQKFTENPTRNAGEASIGFVKKLQSRFNDESKNVDYEHLHYVLDRIASAETAHPEARGLALQTLLEGGEGSIGPQTVDTVKKIFDSKGRTVKDSFENKIVAMTIKAVKDHPIGINIEDSHLSHLYKLVSDDLVAGRLDQGTARSLVRHFADVWKTDKDIEVLKAVRDSDLLSQDIRTLASNAFKSY